MISGIISMNEEDWAVLCSLKQHIKDRVGVVEDAKEYFDLIESIMQCVETTP